MEINLPAGLLTALITPFENGQPHVSSLLKLIQDQLSAGVDGLVYAGTTGEIATLHEQEYALLMRECRQATAGKCSLVVGTGSNSTAEALNRTRLAEKMGVDAVQIVTPYYNKPSQEGLFAHYSLLAENTRLPIMLYSIKSRCGIELEIETVCRLREKFSHICGLKESSTNCMRIGLLRNALGNDFQIYSGDDEMTLPFLSVGATGVVSCAANLLPKAILGLIRAFQAGFLVNAQKLHRQLLPVLIDLFCEVNPVPVKYALNRLGKIPSDEVRLPLCTLTNEHKSLVDKVLQDLPKDWL